MFIGFFTAAVMVEFWRKNKSADLILGGTPGFIVANFEGLCNFQFLYDDEYRKQKRTIMFTHRAAYLR